ncbi:MAG: amino acid adenylation domain-containing protein [Congregibacter sp.]
MLLRRLEAKSPVGPRVENAVQPRANPDLPVPLSTTQQRLWFLDQLAGPSATYNMPIAVRLDGQLDRRALCIALQTVVDRHEALRIRVLEENGIAKQFTRPELQVQLTEVELDQLAPAATHRDSALQQRMAREAATPFDLANDPLIRAQLLALAPEQHVLLITVHHIVADGWSIGRVFLEEFTEAFDAAVAGRQPNLPELTVQYPDYVLWQQQRLGDERLRALETFWQEQLHGLPPALELPTDRSRPAVQTHSGAVHHFSIPGPLLDALKHLGSQHGATLFMVLLAGFACLLGRYSRQEDFAIGSPVAGRDRKELESLIGLFVSSLVLRMRPAPQTSIADWIEEVRATCLGAFGHQDMPFERLVELLSPERTTSFSPLFQVMFILQNQNAQREGLRSGGVEMSSLPTDAASAMFDLTLKLEEQGGALEGELEYNTDLFDAASMAQMAKYLLAIWEAMVENPSMSIGEIPLLDSAELAVTSSALRSDHWIDPSASLCERILAQAHRAPNATAISCASGCLSYGGLSEQSELFAASLVALNLGAEARVGVCLQRRAYLMPVLLGVLRAGLAYVPIDPEYPAERIASMVEQGELALIVTDQESTGNLPQTAIPMLFADAGFTASAAQGIVTFEEPHPEQLAYVIFTSGSTGRPKGVQISHAALTNFLLSMSETPGLSSSDTLVAVTTVSFDIAGLELFLPLMVGASVELVERQVAADGYALLEQLQASAATVMQATPSTWRLLLATGVKKLPVKRAFCGGEALDAALARDLLDAGVELWNLYGPTETTIWSTVRRVTEPPETVPAVDLGFPISSTSLYVLDDCGMLCGIGVPGELHIGGLGISRGYAGQPGLTAERFQPDPFTERPGSRMYRTGDLVVRRPDGRLDYLGRADFQVKLRGYRIELGEVESVLIEHPQIQRAVAIALELGADEQLVAYAETVQGWQAAFTKESEATSNWQLVWDEAYKQGEDVDVPDDFSGWARTLDGQAMGPATMCRWADATAESILSLRPGRVLEIGCGTGIIARRIIGRVDHYLGVDFSSDVLATTAGRLRQAGHANFSVIHASADTVPISALGKIDTLVINSVAQYFPSLDYLQSVLERLEPALAKGAQIFLGDLRHLGLQECFHARIAAAKAGAIAGTTAHPGTSAGDLRRVIHDAIAAERELLFSPGAFYDLSLGGRSTSSRLYLKPEDLDPELGDFRYDVVLTLDCDDTEFHESTRLLPRVEAGGSDDLASLETALKSHPQGFWIFGLNNPRLQATAAFVENLRELPEAAEIVPDEFLPGPTGSVVVGDTTHAAGSLSAYVDWAGVKGVNLALGWDSGNPTRLQALVLPSPVTPNCAGISLCAESASGELSNRPAGSGAETALTRVLMEHLRASLPAFMLPSSIVLLARLPLTPNGKIDRAALPKPDFGKQQTVFVAPSTELEQQICDVWCDILGLTHLGVRDNFFELGGHSLLAVRVIAHLRKRLGVDIALQSLFDAPTVAELALELENGGSSGLEAHEIPVLDSGQRRSAPLTHQQRQLWFLDQLNGPSCTYHVSCVAEIDGTLQPQALKQSIEFIVARHDALRTHFEALDGEPEARVSDQTQFDWLVHRASGDDEQHAIDEALSKPFSLASAPLLRCHVIERSNNTHVMVLVVHHIIADQWSLALLQQELAAAYPAFAEGRRPELPTLPLQYADYAYWRNDLKDSAALLTQLGAWRDRLANAPQFLALPTDRPRPARRTEAGALYVETLSASLATALKALSARTGVTLFMTLLSGWAILLGRRARTDDLVIGVPVSDRVQPELEQLVGFFVNTLPLRLDLSGRPSVDEFIQRVKAATLDMLSHQLVPFEKILEAVNPERSLSHTPIYQAVFVLQNAPGAELSFGGLDLELLPGNNRVSKFDVTLSVEESAQGLECSLEYSTDLFDEDTIRAMMSELTMLWSAMGECSSGEGIHKLPLMETATAQRVLMAANPPTEATQLPVVDLLSQWRLQCGADPVAAALEADGEPVARDALDRWACRVALDLRGRGVGWGDTVGIYAHPSPSMIACMLGVLKLGASYMPLMPDTPAARLATMLGQTGCGLVLDGVGEFPLERIETVLVSPHDSHSDTNSDTTIDRAPPEFPLPPGAATACIIFTSGSTGEPKAVAVSYGNLHASLSARLSYYRESMTGLLLLQPFNFDVASGNILWALSAGGCLHLERRESVQDPERLLQRLVSTRASHLVLLPLLYKPLLAMAGPGQCDALRCVIIGGEQMPPDLPRQHAAVAAQANLYNEYGPTEATVMCAAHPVDPDVFLARQPIGRALGQSRLYVLDDDLVPVPFGVTGELCVGGPQVAAGYIGNPAATAASFVPDPFDGCAGARLYRTGDLARVSRAGLVELLGRDDRQVKIRGHRIELGEVESAITEVIRVREVAVLVIDVGASKQLVAYLAGSQEGFESPQLFRDTLAQKLPVYMVPQFVVSLEALPRTANGKVDHRALPSVDAGQEASATDAVDQSGLEGELAKIWCDVLGKAHVASHENFFALGGDSILCIQVVSRARQAGMALSAAQLFEHQTISELVPRIGVAAAQPVILSTEPEQFPATPIQQWFLSRYGKAPNHFNQSLMLRIDKQLSDERIRGALAALQRTHPMLRVRLLSAVEKDWQLGCDKPKSESELDFESLDVSDVDSDTLTAHAERAQAALDIARGPIWCARRIVTAGDDDRLLLVIHHMAVDGVSWRILMDDLQQLIASDDRADLVPGYSFGRWAQALTEYVVSAASRQYWLETAQPTTLPLNSVADVDAVNRHGTEQTVSFSVPGKIADALLGAAPSALFCGIQDLLLSALHATISAWSGENTVGLTLEGHGRQVLLPGIDLGRTVGWFTASYPMILRADSNSSSLERLRVIRDARQRIPLGGVEFGLLRYQDADPAVRRQLAAGEFQPISFNYLGQFHQQSGSGEILGEARESVGREHDLDGPRPHLIDINGYFSEGELKFFWTFCPELHAPDTISHLAGGMIDALGDLVEQSMQPVVATPYVPSDFPLVDAHWDDCETLFKLAGRQVSKVYPLNRMQQGMLFHSQIDRDGGAYVIQYACTLDGVLNPEQFHAAWERVLQRHEALRTCVLTRDNTDPLQVVFDEVILPWSEQDWRDLDAARRDARWDALLREDRARGFEPDCAPMMRCQLVRLTPDCWQFLWSQHHVVSDGWSLPIILADVLREYDRVEGTAALTAPTASGLEPYIRWLQARDMGAARDFWSQYLDSLPGPTRLGWRQPESDSLAYASRQQIIPRDSASALYAMAREHNTTINRLVELALGVVIASWTEGQDVVFGATVSGRPAEVSGVEDMVGMFINTVPVRLRWSGSSTTFSELLAQLQAQHGKRLAHEHLPFVSINELAGLGARQQLFDCLCVFENYPLDASLGSGRSDLQVRDVDVLEQTNFPATLTVQPGETIKLGLSLARKWFEASAADSLLDTLVELLTTLPERAGAAVCAEDGATLSKLTAELAALRPGRPDLHREQLVLDSAASRETYAKPANDSEQFIADTYAAVLELEPADVGRHDDFFDLGGHSLIAGRVASRLSLHWTIDVPIASVFEHSSVASLASYIDNQQWAQADLGELAHDEEEFVL